MSLPAVSKHLKVLERAGLIARGREAQWRPCRLEAAPLKDVADWMEHYRRFWERASIAWTSTCARCKPSNRRRSRMNQRSSGRAESRRATNLTRAFTNSAARRKEMTMTEQTSPLNLKMISDTEIEMSRVFNAPRQLVFEAYSKPEHVKRWWGQRGSTMTSCEIDFRPGGKWRFVTREKDGNEYAFRGEFREIVEPERIVQTFEFEPMAGHISVDHLTLTEQDGKTTMTIRSTFDSKEDLEGMISSGMETGAAESYDRLEELLQTLA